MQLNKGAVPIVYVYQPAKQRISRPNSQHYRATAKDLRQMLTLR
jgi:hypothetical protein